MQPSDYPVIERVRPGTLVVGYRASKPHASPSVNSPFVSIIEFYDDDGVVGEDSPWASIRFDSHEEIMSLIGALLYVAQEVLTHPPADALELDDIDRSDLSSALDELGLSFTDDDDDEN